MLTTLSETNCSLDFYSTFLRDNFAGACSLGVGSGEESEGSLGESPTLLPISLKLNELLVAVPRSGYVRSRHVGGLSTGLGEPAALTGVIIARSEHRLPSAFLKEFTLEARMLFALSYHLTVGTTVLCSPQIKKNDLTQSFLDLGMVGEDFARDYLILRANTTSVYGSFQVSGGLRESIVDILMDRENTGDGV